MIWLFCGSSIRTPGGPIGCSRDGHPPSGLEWFSQNIERQHLLATDLAEPSAVAANVGILGHSATKKYV
jgi:hypothetical protein